MGLKEHNLCGNGKEYEEDYNKEYSVHIDIYSRNTRQSVLIPEMFRRIQFKIFAIDHCVSTKFYRKHE
jgi:hypothetical protein